MFLKLSSPSQASVNSKLTVVIAIDREAVHRLPAELVRTTDIGIGVKFDYPLPLALFEALLAKNLPLRQPQFPDSSQLSEFVLNQGKTIFKATVSNFLPNLERHFLRAAETAKSNAEQTALFEVNHVLQRQQAQLNSELENCFLRKAQAYFSPDIRPEQSKPTAHRLSLLDQSDFEDWLNLTETATRIEVAYQDKLQPLRYLFTMACRHGSDSIPPPIFPIAQYECLRTALDQVGVKDVQARKIVYLAFAEALYPNVQIMLAQFEQRYQIDLIFLTAASSRISCPAQPMRRSLNPLTMWLTP
ncbi:MAG: DUF1631 domain-containing protein, partial [Methylohalobius sp.]|nr:DUF1631 domain-containing protein [Methylohalobius sp.]